MLPVRRRRWIAAAALAVPILVWSAPFWPRSRCLFGLDYNSYFRPHLILARDSLRKDGELPRWNPYQYAGTPYLGNLQCQLFYPPNWILFALPAEESYEFLAVLHLALAAWGAYRLARALRIGRTGAVLAALAFSMSMSLGARVLAGHLTNFVAQALAPMFLHLLLRVLRKPTAAGTAALGAWSGLLVTGGTPQWILQTLFVGAGLVGWKLWTAARDRRPWRGALAALAVAGVLGLAASAVSWLPAFEVSAESTRGGTRNFYPGLGGVGPQQGLFPFDLLHAVTPWIPSAEQRMWDYWWHEKALYVGILPLLLALSGIRRGPALFFAIAGAVALLDAMVPPVHWLLSWLPGYGKFRVPGRSAWIVVLCLSVLAGYGWEARRPRVLWIVAGAAVAAAIVSAIRYSAFREAALAAGLVGVALFLLHRKQAGLAVVFAAADLVFFGLWVQKTVPREAYGCAPWYDAHIGNDRAHFRLLDEDNNDAQYVARGYRLLNGYGHPLPRRTVDLYARAWSNYRGARPESLSAGTRIADPDVLARLNVRWIVGREMVPHPRWREVARNGREVLYEDPAVRTLAFTEAGACLARRPSVNRVEVMHIAHAARTLIVSETWTPGWRAEVNGRAVPVRAHEGALLSVDLPEGASYVLFVYDPPIARTALVISAVGLALLPLVAALSLFRRKS